MLTVSRMTDNIHHVNSSLWLPTITVFICSRYWGYNDVILKWRLRCLIPVHKAYLLTIVRLPSPICKCWLSPSPGLLPQSCAGYKPILSLYLYLSPSQSLYIYMQLPHVISVNVIVCTTFKNQKCMWSTHMTDLSISTHW